MDRRLAAAPVVRELAAGVDPFLEGLYVAGSIATGDYRPGVSDIDAVALVEHVPPPSIRKALVQTHERLVRDVDGGSALHCVYVSRPEVADLAHGHWTWAFNELFRRPLSGIARAELLADPVIVAGPPPSSWLPPMSIEALRDAARSELAGYWTMALRKPAIWMHDVYIDTGVTCLVRAEITTSEGRLVTKAEAIARMPDFGVPSQIAEGIARRRRGDIETLTERERKGRAVIVRAFLRDRIASLLHGR